MTAEGLAALKSKGWAVVSGNEFATDLVKEHFVIQKLFAKDTPIFDGEKACVLDEEFLFYSKFGWTPSYEVDPDQDVMESNCTITLSNSFETKGNVYDKSTKDGLSGASIFVLDIDGEPLFDEPIVTDSDGDYEITLTDEQFANIGHVYLTKDGYIDRFVEGDVLFQPIDKHNTNIDMEKELEADFKLYDQSATSIFEGFMVYGRFHTKGTIVQISDEPQKDLSTTLQIGARIGEGSLPREEKINSLSSKDEERDLYYQAEQ